MEIKSSQIFSALSDIGHKRENNEDAFIVEGHNDNKFSSKDLEMLFVVADGMGGHTCGEVASSIACKNMLGTLYSLEGSVETWCHQLETHFYLIDDYIRTRASNEPKCAHMGTTLTALILKNGHALISHVGDSRIYRLHNQELSRLTTDHTFVQEMIEEGELTPEAASNHPFRNMLTQVVGTQEPLEYVETTMIDLIPGDKFLISSDGLHDTVTFDEIANTLGNGKDPKITAQKLMALALSRGGKDNITIIVVFIPTQKGSVGIDKGFRISICNLGLENNNE